MKWTAVELQAVVDVLEQDHETAREAARAVLDASRAILRRRDSYAAITRMDEGLTLIYAPWWDKRAAAKAAEALPGDRAVIRVFSSAGLEDRQAVRPTSKECPECGHPRLAHIARQWRAYKAPTMLPAGCMVGGCGCTVRS
jgi:hypothetical protein